MPEAPTTIGPLLHVYATSPASANGSITKAVPLNASIKIKFDRYLLPETAVRQSLLVTGGSFAVDGGAPIGGVVSFEPTYDPLAREVTYRPQGQYQPSTLYTAILRKPSEDDNGFGFRAWDGAELETTYKFQFETAADATTLEPTPPADGCGVCVPGPTGAPGTVDDLALVTLTGSSCAFGGCHAPATGAAPPHGAMALDLSSFQSIDRTARSRVAHQTLTGATSEAERRSLVFGRSMPIIDPGNPGNSYLVYKLLIDARLYSDAVGADADAAEGLPTEDIQRLAASFVAGVPMPYGGTLTFAEAKAISRWIARGASTCDDRQPIVNCACTLSTTLTLSGAGGAAGAAGSAGAGAGGAAAGTGGAAGAGAGGASGAGGAGVPAGATCKEGEKPKSYWDAKTGTCTSGCGLKCAGDGCTLPWASCADAIAACAPKP